MKRILALPLIFVLACGKTASAPSVSLGADTPLSERLTARTAVLDPTCDFDQRQLHPDVDSLVAEFVRRASIGEFDRTEPWLPTAEDCSGHEPGYDMIFVLDSVSAHVEYVAADSARYLLVSRLLGVLGDARSVPSARIDTIELYRSEFGWRLANPLFWNWMTPKSDRARRWLDSLAREGTP